jgi:imidazolonepropionase-like amidohydrolase
MAFGTDLFRAPKEYQAEEFLVRAEALPAAEIIRSATVIGAEVVGMEGRLGRVAQGYLADLLLVDGDPLTDLGLFQDQGAHLPLIMKDGAIVKNTLSADMTR